jgi:hypothetical protein
MDWTQACAVLGVSGSATDVEIKEQYIYKAQLLHPDKNQDKPENIRKKAEAELALINQTYAFINNPNNNPYKIPPRLSVEPLAVRFKDVSMGEKKSTSVMIRNAGGPYTSIWIDNQPAPWLTVAGVKSITGERLPLEVTLECTGTGEPGKQYYCDLVIRIENENTHVVDQVIVKFELYTRSMPAEVVVEKEVASAPPKITVEAPINKAAPKSMPQNKLGFSFSAFLVNFLAFVVVGIASYYFVSPYFKIDDLLLLAILSLFAVIAISTSVIQGISLGTKNNRTKIKI